MAAGKESGSARIVELLDDILKPRGFDRQSRLWRRDGENTVIAVSLSESDDILDVDFCAWLKASGEVDPLAVKRGPGGKRHLESSLSDVVPEPQSWRLSRVFHLDLDYAKNPAVLHYDDYTEDEKQAILRALEPDAALTMEWRTAALRGIMEDHVLPLLGRIEAGEITDQLQLQAGGAALDLVAEVCRLHEASTEDDDVIDFLFNNGVLPAIAWEIIEEAYRLKSWQGGKLAERIDEKWAMRRKAKAQ
jgi:hypothetical protein